MNSPISPELSNDCWCEVFKYFDSPADFRKVACDKISSKSLLKNDA